MSSRALQNKFEFLLFRLFNRIARSLPRRTALALGEQMGRFFGILSRKRKKIAFQNMRSVFPALPEAEIHLNIREMFRHLGISGMEMLRMDLLDDKDIQGLFRITGEEHLHEAFRLDRGVILLSGHVGFWEIGSFLFPRLGFPVDYVAKRMKNPQVNTYFNQMREAGGSQGIDKRNAARKIVRSLSRNRGVAVLLDQHSRPPEGIQINFLGRPAYTSSTITRLAMKNRVPVVPVFVFRNPDNTYHVSIRPLMLLDETAGVTENTTLLTMQIEKAIHQEVSQWLWLHRRWREVGTPKHDSPPHG